MLYSHGILLEYFLVFIACFQIKSSILILSFSGIEVQNFSFHNISSPLTSGYFSEDTE
jgi:hypothetical protein